MAQRIQLKRGNFSALPNSGMLAGEPMVTLDRGTLHVATDPTSKMAIVPAIDALATLAAIDVADLLIVHDSDASSGQREKKVSFADFKAALNIPASSTDEKVAIVSGATAGYIWGTDGTDGVLRMGNSMKWQKDPGNGFVTFDVDVIDGGTF